MQKEGRLPPVRVMIKPLDNRPAFTLTDFLSYNFSSSLMVPVDTFSFQFVAPDDIPFYDRVKEGDIAVLEANGINVCTGVIDSVDISTDGEGGERVSVTGRDILAQFEDQDAISFQDKPIWIDKTTLLAAVKQLTANTKIQSVRVQDAPDGTFLFATEPGETKLSALQRFCEPLNCIFWTDGAGVLVIGKPNMRQAPTGQIVVSKADRISNVTSIKVVRSSTQIGNIIVPVWAGQETVTERVPENQRINNDAEGPTRLRKLSYRVPKTVVVSTPQGSSPQGGAQLNFLENSQGQRIGNTQKVQVASGGIGAHSLLVAHALREIARANFKEMIVQATVPGHYNDNGDPFVVDKVYQVFYDRGSVDEKMYLFQVEYEMDQNGMKTSLFFTKLGTICSDVRAL